MRFIYTLLGVGFVICFYGCKQEWLGFFDFELNWIYADEERFGLIFVDWRFRKFSVLNDPTVFGIFGSAILLINLILLPATDRLGVKLLLIFMAIIAALSMIYSGTRTAYVTTAVGLGLYFLITLNHRNTVFASLLGVVIILLILYGPFYGPNITRLRTIFEVQDDASYLVREINRARIQPYILSHPIGGGATTTGDNGIRFYPGHYLAGFPTDSNFVLTALEYGWMGLLIKLVSYFIILYDAIRRYFRLNNKVLKSIQLSFIAIMFSMIVGEYAQDSAKDQFPLCFIFYAGAAVTSKIDYFENDNDQLELF